MHYRATLSIDTRDCIGCEVCVAHCDKGVLRMIDGKALVDLRNLNQCDLDGECVAVCPTNVVTLKIEPAEDPVELTAAEMRNLIGADADADADPDGEAEVEPNPDPSREPQPV